MKFYIKGHPNVLCAHRTTIEFTKDSDLTKNGDCILGVSADFKVDKQILAQKKVEVTIACDGLTDSLIADINPDFKDSHEMVFRKTNFISDRTLGINASKAAFEIDRRIVDILKNEGKKALVTIKGL